MAKNAKVGLSANKRLRQRADDLDQRLHGLEDALRAGL